MMNTKTFHWITLVIGVSIAILGYRAWDAAIFSSHASRHLLAKSPYRNSHHVHDIAGVLPEQDLPRFEQYMNWIMQESDVDVRFVFVKDTGEKTIEQLAVDLVDELRIPGKLQVFLHPSS
jgi:uncharacterized membrane protein YgcG